MRDMATRGRMAEEAMREIQDRPTAPKPAAVPASAELKPCPFCGSVGTIHEGDQIFWTECHTCNLDLEYQDTREAAIAAWNTRTPAASPVAGVSAEKEFLCSLLPKLDAVERLALKLDRQRGGLKLALEVRGVSDRIIKRAESKLAQPSAEGDGWIAVTPETTLPFTDQTNDARWSDDFLLCDADGDRYIGSFGQYRDDPPHWSRDAGNRVEPAYYCKLPTPPSVQEEKGSK